MHKLTHTHTNAQTHTHTHTTHMHAHTHTKNMHTLTCMHIHTHTKSCTQKQTHTYARMRTTKLAHCSSSIPIIEVEAGLGIVSTASLQELQHLKQYFYYGFRCLRAGLCCSTGLSIWQSFLQISASIYQRYDAFDFMEITSVQQRYGALSFLVSEHAHVTL